METKERKAALEKEILNELNEIKEKKENYYLQFKDRIDELKKQLHELGTKTRDGYFVTEGDTVYSEDWSCNYEPKIKEYYVYKEYAHILNDTNNRPVHVGNCFLYRDNLIEHVKKKLISVVDCYKKEVEESGKELKEATEALKKFNEKEFK